MKKMGVSSDLADFCCNKCDLALASHQKKYNLTNSYQHLEIEYGQCLHEKFTYEGIQNRNKDFTNKLELILVPCMNQAHLILLKLRTKWINDRPGTRRTCWAALEVLEDPEGQVIQDQDHPERNRRKFVLFSTFPGLLTYFFNYIFNFISPC